jgi:hypothetical protein
MDNIDIAIYNILGSEGGKFKYEFLGEIPFTAFNAKTHWDSDFIIGFDEQTDDFTKNGIEDIREKLNNTFDFLYVGFGAEGPIYLGINAADEDTLKKERDNEGKQLDLSPSVYGMTSGTECLAEIFVACCMKDKNLTQDMVDFFNRFSETKIELPK